MTESIKEEFWDRLEDARVGMLSGGDARAVPMSHYVDDDHPEQGIWFITAKQTDLAQAAAKAPQGTYIVSSTKQSLYARIDGTLHMSNDPAQLDRIWNAVADAWFEGGKQDSDVQLLQFKPTTAEVWVTGGSMKFLYEIAKSTMTDSKPDMGEHAEIIF